MVVNPDESKNEAMELVGVSIGNKAAESEPPLPVKAMMTTEKLEEQEEDPSIIREEDKLDSINFGNFFNLRLPQIRAFHLAWFGFFTAFVAWFSIAPLMPLIKDSLNLTKDQVSYANLASVSSTILAKTAFGPLSDRFGPKRTMAGVLLFGAIPIFFTGAVNSASGLIVLRAAIGLLGASFVMSQAWTSNMIKMQWAGTANAMVAGWGNLGGGVTQVMMVQLFSQMVKSGMGKEEAWRNSFYVPGTLLVVVACMIYFIGQDTPKGDLKTLRRRSNSAAGGKKDNTASRAMWIALTEGPTYILALQYAASFGVELTGFNMAASYFHDQYKVSVVRAGNIALLAGITDIFSRAMGGFLSDYAFKELGMKGRLVMQWLLLFFGGVLLVWFSHAEKFHLATMLLPVFSVFAQAASGSCFAIAPYVSPYKGSVVGIVGAGGNVGGMIFSLLFLLGNFKNMATGYEYMGWSLVLISFTIFFIRPSDLSEYTRVSRASSLDGTRSVDTTHHGHNAGDREGGDVEEGA